MKTNEELFLAAKTTASQTAAILITRPLDCIPFLQLCTLETNLRVALAAITELKNRAAGHQPPKEG
jgi:hypothetical protein